MPSQCNRSSTTTRLLPTKDEIMSQSKSVLQRSRAVERAIIENKSRRNGHDLELAQQIVAKAANDQDAILSVLKEAYQTPDKYINCEKTRRLFLKAVDNLLCEKCKNALLDRLSATSSELTQCFASHLGLRLESSNSLNQSCISEEDSRRQ